MNENYEDVPHLGINEVVLVHYNCQQRLST